MVLSVNSPDYGEPVITRKRSVGATVIHIVATPEPSTERLFEVYAICEAGKSCDCSENFGRPQQDIFLQKSYHQSSAYLYVIPAKAGIQG